MADVTRHRSVATVLLDQGDRVMLTREPDEPGEQPTRVQLDKQLWKDMGEPSVVTITVEPGDLLNDEATDG